MTESLEIANRYFDLSNKSDFDGIGKLLTETTTYSSQTTGFYLGRDDILTMQQAFHARFATLKWTVKSVEEVKPGIVLFDYDFAGKPHNGEKIETSGSEHIIVYQNKIRHVEIRSKAYDTKTNQEIATQNITPSEKRTIDTLLNGMPIFKKINAILVKVPSIQEGLDFYHKQLGLQIFWKKGNIASVRLGNGQLVMSTTLDPETNILVESVDHAAEVFVRAGGKVVSPPEDIDVGKLVIVEDPFGNHLTLVDFSKGFYKMDEFSNVIGVE